MHDKFKELQSMRSIFKQKDLLYVLVVTGVFLLLYASTFADLYHAWSTDEDYSHGFLIIPISLYLIWKKREELRQQSIQPNNWGIAILAVWACIYFLGYMGDISTFVSYSMIVFLLGLMITTAGVSITTLVLFPVLFLFFMIPIPSELYTMLTNPLQLVATTSSVWVLQQLQVPVYQEGNILQMPNYSMRVVVACSGIRSLMAITALALLMGYILFKSNVRRFLLFLFSLPISLLGNILRISVTGLIAYHVSSEMAEGYSHTFAGMVTFVIAFITLFVGVYLIQWLIPEKE